MSSNQELMSRVGGILGSMGVQKSSGVHTTANTSVGDFMDRKVVERLVDLTVSESQWMSEATVRLRSQRAGEIPRMVLNDVVTEGVAENDGNTIDTRIDTTNIEYNCKKFKATWFITHEAMREARASGESNFDSKVRGAFAKALGNDLARVALNGDTGLPATTRMNRLLRHRDGWLKQMRSKGIQEQTTVGSPYAQALWPAMQASMPRQYRDDSGLRFFIPSLLDISHTEEIGENIAGGSRLAERARVERERFAPRGIPQLIVPQMPEDQGFATLSGSPSPADTIVVDGAGLKFTVNTVFGGYSAEHVGRRLEIINPVTGQGETVVVKDEGGTDLVVVTIGTLGQAGAPSLVPADYTIDIHDTTSAFLTNPANLFVVFCDRMRAYRKFEQEHERFRLDVYYEADFGIFNEDAIVIQDGIVVPSFKFGS